MQAPDQQWLLSRLAGLADPPPGGGEGPEAAVAICVAPDASGAPHVLLIKRAEHPLDPWSGQVGLPGGRRDPGDPDVLFTATRETHEEVGIALESRQLIGSLPPLQARRRGVTTDLLVHPIVFELDDRPEPIPSYEVAAARWVSVAALIDPAHGTTHEVQTPAGVRGFPGVHVHGADAPPWVLWGLTYRMLSDVLAHANLTLAAGRP